MYSLYKLTKQNICMPICITIKSTISPYSTFAHAIWMMRSQVPSNVQMWRTQKRVNAFNTHDLKCPYGFMQGTSIQLEGNSNMKRSIFGHWKLPRFVCMFWLENLIPVIKLYRKKHEASWLCDPKSIFDGFLAQKVYSLFLLNLWQG